jgi:hypothetical protein
LSDVTVAVLTLGEATLGRALGSLETQTHQPADIVVVGGVRPFYCALRLAAERVRTPFFLQLDSDMVLDPSCLALLRGAFHDEVGIAVGQLRDPLMGTIAGVKMFRTACFREVQVRNSLSPDVDFYRDLGELGWLTLHVTRYASDEVESLHTFGDHWPDYTTSYTYAKYRTLGARYRSRRDLGAAIWRMERLRRSTHEVALIARVALGHGLFHVETRDVPRRAPATTELAVLEGLLSEPAKGETRVPELLPDHQSPEAAEARFVSLGRALAVARDFVGARTCLKQLARTDVRRSWLAEASLGHGLLTQGRGGAAPMGLGRLMGADEPLLTQAGS